MRSRTSWDRWPEVDGLFAQALECPREEREAFLTEACRGDVALIDAIRGLLTASESAESGLGAPAHALLREVFADDDDASDTPARAPGDSIGRYRLIRELGRGGMATVYEAERADGTYEQRVAVKLLRRGLDSAEIARRFQMETQILSTMAHPNIARLLDGGTTDDGQPYLVMELVVGEPITEWADRHRLDVDDRLDLFAQIADAAAFAHKHLIVHRDLKPSNVLVGHDGLVKLLDFGIAKLLEEDAAHVAETRTATRWMTPGYAAPEQILGKPVTTATDVHGLGLLLYELVAGRRPFGAEGMSGFDLDRAICEDIPTRPSSMVSTWPGVAHARNTGSERLRRQLSGDLDAIVAKALRKEPEERYASVQAMAKDIERHRTGFPVEARAGLRVYSARKFVRRHRLGVGATAAILITLLISSLLLWRQQIATAQARDEAATEAENAGLIIDFLADVFRGRNPEQAPADTLTVRELLAWGSERVDREFADRPALRAQLLQTLGSAFVNVGLAQEGLSHLSRSVELSRSAYGSSSSEVADGLLELSVGYRVNRNPTPALPAATEALGIRRASLPPDDPAIASALMELARVYTELHQPDSAEPLLREALRVSEANGNDVQSAHAAADLARVRRGQGAFREAARLYETAIPTLRREGDDALIAPLNNHAYLLRTLEDFARAEPLYRESLAISTRLYGRGHPSSLNVANNLAAVLHEQGKQDAAIAILRESTVAANAQWADGNWQVGATHAALGRALMRLHRFDEAFTELAAAHAIYSRFLGADHLWTFFIEATIAAGYVVTGRDERGQEYLDTFYRHRVDNPPASASQQQGLIDLVRPFVNTLRDLGLQNEVERFHALIEPYVRERGERTR